MPTTATPQRLSGMIAVSKDSKVKPLGYIVWFSVPDEDIRLAKLRKAWGLAGLDMTVLPKDQKAVNAFKRAVRNQEGMQEVEASGGGRVRVETDVRDVLENEQDVIYQISRVVRDLDNRVVEYPKALRVWFSKVTEEIGFKPLGEVSRKQVLPIMEAIQFDYEAASKTVTGAKVRTLVRHYIKDDSDEKDKMVGLSGENMRGKAGGVYFVLAKFNEQLEALADMLHNLYDPHGRAYLYSVPMADGKGERELIRSRFVANTVDEMDEAMTDVAGLLRDGRQREVRENVIKFHWRRLERFKRRAAQYQEALREEEEDLHTRMDMLHRQLRKLGDL